MASDVQVFVQFKEPCVFAGEELICTITFKNGAESQESPAVRGTNFRGGFFGHMTSTERGHASQRSMNFATATREQRSDSFPLSSPPLPKSARTPMVAQRPSFKHQRSLSIVATTAGFTDPASVKEGHSFTKNIGHRRSSTVHVVGDQVRRVNSGDQQAFANLRIPGRGGRRSPLSGVSPSDDNTPRSTPEFKFPAEDHETLGNGQSTAATPKLLIRDRVPQRIPSHLSNNNSDRNSLDIYSHANHSGETLGSEQTSMISERPQIANITAKPLQRAGSLATRRPRAVKLLMGYAQVGATFTLDASLVDQTPFEEVKKKGFLGGQAGGGVVGVKKKSRPTSGLFGGFNFTSLGESLESIMGGDNLSSIKEMKAVTSSRAIPLLSTPQSLLFVDLHLEPGDEKSYSFVYKLPKGLPSSYRGKAIKTAYNLIIGIQSDPGKREMQAVRQVNIPLRVFSGVDLDGEIFGHDLMQPYVILRDIAKTKVLGPGKEEITGPKSPDTRSTMTAKDFLRNVDTLLDRRRRRQSSTTTIDLTFGASDLEGSVTSRAINQAIMLSNQPTGPNESSSNKFEITRSGLAIATVILDRPLHRLGETVTTVIDFSTGQMTCTSLRATLESAERVDGSLAVRSPATISRITRRVYGSQSQNVLFCKRAVFRPTIPVTATPTFVTSGVNLDWYIKLEFGTVSNESGTENERPTLLEEMMQDERGIVNVAVESLNCDTFEVSIPITVYGDVVRDSKDSNEVNGITI